MEIKKLCHRGIKIYLVISRINLTENVNIKGGFRPVILHKEMKNLYIVGEKVQIIHLVEYAIIFLSSGSQWGNFAPQGTFGNIWIYFWLA